VPATGISIGVSRLLFGLQRIGRYRATTMQGPVFVLVLDRDRIDYYQQLASKLRKARIPTEVYLGESGITAQMRYADRRRSPCVIIQGSNEYSNPSGPLVLIKDLAEGARLSAEIADSVTWREQRPGQVCVPEQEMVSVVKDVLRRRKILSHHKL
jgi:histidyl-tRNA synthetase